MANPGYVRSTDGSDADNGSTWALANATLAGAMADQVAGDRIWISNNHAETQASAMTITAPGTIASPNEIAFGDDAAQPPTALSASGSITTTGAFNISISGSFYWYGGTLNAGTGAGSQTINLATGDNNYQSFESTTFALVATGASGRVNLGSGTATTETEVSLVSPVFSFASTSHAVNVNGKVRIKGGSITGSAIANFIAAPSIRCDLEVDGFDFTGAASSVNLISGTPPAVGIAIFRNCVMPASWSGSLVASGFANSAFRAEAWNCAAAVASGTNNFSMWVEDAFGSAKHETTIVRTGGASDGDTPLSWKIATSADAQFPAMVFRSLEIAVPLTSTGDKTFTVHFVSDENVAAGQGAGTGNAFRDDEFWLEARVLGTTDSPKSTIATGRPSIVATPTDHAASTETWTTTGMTTPQKQKLALTTTLNEECTVMITICGANASKTVYFCPKVEVS